VNDSYPPSSKPHSLPEIDSCFGSDARRILEPPGATQIQADVSGFSAFRGFSNLTAQWLPAKRQRVADGTKILLDIAKESSDCFPFLKSALGFVNALIKHYEVVVEWVAVVHN